MAVTIRVDENLSIPSAYEPRDHLLGDRSIAKSIYGKRVFRDLDVMSHKEKTGKIKG